jgi:hypothetical protein
VFLLFFSLVTLARNPELNPSQQSYWHKLLHYRKNPLRGYVSEVDSQSFFTSSEGKINPEAEIKSSIEILNSSEGQKFVCKFPLRYRWLKENTSNNWKFSTDKCPIYQAFKAKLGAKNISLVFSSFYINNPGSTFGHTFLRINRYQEFRSNELLDYALPLMRPKIICFCIWLKV